MSQEELGEFMKTINAQLQMIDDISPVNNHMSADKIVQLMDQKCKELTKLLVKRKYIVK